MDRYINQRLRQLRQEGVKQVKPLASGRNDECPHCKEMSGTVFPIEEFPEYPLPGCTCTPNCGCVVIRVM